MYGGSRDELSPMTEDMARRWVERLLDHDYGWVIETDILIGQIRLDRVDLRDKRASLAFGNRKPGGLGTGQGTEAIGLVLGWPFGVIGLHRVYERVVEYNARAIRAYEKCGFVREGREREAAFVDGAWHEDIMMGVLDRDYAARKPEQP